MCARAHASNCCCCSRFIVAALHFGRPSASRSGKNNGSDAWTADLSSASRMFQLCLAGLGPSRALPLTAGTAPEAQRRLASVCLRGGVNAVPEQMAVAGGQDVARRADVNKAESGGILTGAFGHGVDIETVEFPGWTERRGNLIKRALGRLVEQLRQPGCVFGSPEGCIRASL